MKSSDVRTAGAAVRAYAQGQYVQGAALQARISDPAVRKLVAWYAYTRPSSGARFADIAAFIQKNPQWPWPKVLRKNLELAVRANTKPDAIIAFYRKSAPVHFAGQKLAIERLMAAGRKQDAVWLARLAWARGFHRRRAAAEFRSRYGAWLRPADNYAKMDNLLFLGYRRAAAYFLRTLKLTPQQRAAIQTRVAMGLGRHYCGRRRAALAYIKGRLAPLPYEMKRGEGFAFDRARYFSCSRQLQAAAAAFAAQPSKPRFPARWWRERSKLARDAMRVRNYRLAYSIVSGHRQFGQKLHAHAEWFAGFIAFRFLKRYDRAEQHFRGALASVESAWTRSKILYWHGRLKRVRGQKKAARALFLKASKLGTTFYGQLAHGAVKGGEPPIIEGKVGRPKAASFWRDDLVKAMIVARRLGLWRETWSLARHAMVHRARTPAQHMFLAAVLNRFNIRTKKLQLNVRVMKYAHYRGHPLIGKGYPTIRLPKANTVEPALIYALIRQESEFNAGVGSWAGARGYMQLMPATARKEARDLKLRYRTSYLTRRPAYNLRLGTHHVRRLLDELDGSYPLVLAGYNAGHHRVVRWLASNGDPRARGGPDWETWIEMIPFDETRDYVKRVLEAHTIYRVLLDDKVDTRKLVTYWRPPKLALADACRMLAEAHKPQGGHTAAAKAAARPAPKAAAGKTKPGGKSTLLAAKVPNADLLIGVKKSEAQDPLALVVRPPKDNVAGVPSCADMN